MPGDHHDDVTAQLERERAILADLRERVSRIGRITWTGRAATTFRLALGAQLVRLDDLGDEVGALAGAVREHGESVRAHAEEARRLALAVGATVDDLTDRAARVVVRGGS
ncbi:MULTISPECIES: hypothetical protein [unclassified Janibacter]|uniref:hypothetical protein n=1 Tax=unclassified Janibacter TaxID=2649294 RepID=UPI003D08EEFA